MRLMMVQTVLEKGEAWLRLWWRERWMTEMMILSSGENVGRLESASKTRDGGCRMAWGLTCDLAWLIKIRHFSSKPPMAGWLTARQRRVSV